MSLSVVSEEGARDAEPTSVPVSEEGMSDACGTSAMSVTEVLLARGRAGDPEAINLLFERCLPPLTRWARGRIPMYARNVVETNDIVQETVLSTLRRLDHFEPRRVGALLAYLRQAVENRVRDVIRHTRRHPSGAEIPDEVLDDRASPLDAAIGQEAVERYETALSQLRPVDRELIVARVERQFTFLEMTELLGKPSPDAVRVAVNRALVRLARTMDSLPPGAGRRLATARERPTSGDESPLF